MDLKTDQEFSRNGSQTELKKRPSLELCQQLPQLRPQAIQKAVLEFIEEAQVHAQKEGFFNQTIQSIANAAIFNVPGSDFWLAHEDGEVAGYALCHVVKDIDNRLCYWVSQGWVAKAYRNGKDIRESWKKLEERAKQVMCSHIVNVTNRNAKAYLRLLGKDWHEYSTLLKKDL